MAKDFFPERPKVTPTIYVYQIIEALKIAKKKGLNIPIVYNSNGYESIETLKALEGYIDVYLPDLKYYYDDIALKYSGIKDSLIEFYHKNASKSTHYFNFVKNK